MGEICESTVILKLLQDCFASFFSLSNTSKTFTLHINLCSSVIIITTCRALFPSRHSGGPTEFCDCHGFSMISLLMHILHPDDGKMADESRDHQIICTLLLCYTFYPRRGLILGPGWWGEWVFGAPIRLTSVALTVQIADSIWQPALQKARGQSLAPCQVWKCGKQWKLADFGSFAKLICWNFAAILLCFLFICSWDTVETSWNCKDLWLQFLSLAAMSHGVAAVEIQTEEVLMFELVGSKPWTWMT